MVARIRTVAFQGMDVLDIDVQVQIANGLPSFTIVGLPDKAVAESRERVRSALHAMGLSLPPKRLTVNLAPADVAKEGSHFDLPIALGLLTAMDILPQEEIGDFISLGELSLDGRIRPVSGVLPAAVHAQAVSGRLICPAASGGEAAWAGEMEIVPADTLMQLINHFKGTQVVPRPVPASFTTQTTGFRGPDLSAVRGQETAKRALEITAAGGHNLLMIGPPGSGKSMLASCLPGILPPLSAREALEVSMIHSLAGSLPGEGLVTARPFRDPHHSASQPALIGGGNKVRPGEISLAHNGVLFLDELPEFNRSVLEAMRQPLETGETLIARANSHVTFPARFQLVAAMNPCRCGYLGDPAQECTRAPKCGGDYQARLSGPLLDRIDLQAEVPPVTIAELAQAPTGESSATVAARVARARAMQEERSPGLLNARLQSDMLERHATLAPDAAALLHDAAARLKLSARGYFRTLRVARTVADLEGSPGAIARHHVAEALSYRKMAAMELAA